MKDQAETAGIMTCFGSIALDGYIPNKDATAIAKLHAAGAIILAKTAMPDFATSWFGYSSKSGTTKNPYDLGHDPGGSSGGTGAAVAANLGAIGLGEDTGGSIRLPSSFDNLVGLKVTPRPHQPGRHVAVGGLPGLCRAYVSYGYGRRKNA